MPTLSGDYFQDTVSLLVDHNDDGAFGLVINRPLDATISDVFPQIGGRFDCPVLEGGPVQQDSIFFLHEGGREFQSTYRVSDEIYLTTSRDFVESMSKGEAPLRTLAIAGYAGWGSLQLENEISNNLWLLVPANATIVFDTPFPDRAAAAARILGIDLNLISPISRQ